MVGRELRRQARSRGFLLPTMAAGVAALAAIVGVIGYSLYSFASTTMTQNQRVYTSQLLAQAAYTLAVESADADTDGYPETTAGTVVLGDGWNIPASSAAPKTDAWGSAVKYCPYDNGTTNSSAGRLSGDNPGSLSSIVVALVSSGADRTFQTSCAQAKAGTPQGDDLIRSMTVTQLKQGVGGTKFYGDPVADDTALAALNTSNIPTGQIRLVIGTGRLKYWSGSAWTSITSSSTTVAINRWSLYYADRALGLP